MIGYMKGIRVDEGLKRYGFEENWSDALVVPAWHRLLHTDFAAFVHNPLKVTCKARPSHVSIRSKILRAPLERLCTLWGIPGSESRH